MEALSLDRAMLALRSGERRGLEQLALRIDDKTERRPHSVRHICCKKKFGS
jgi:hypothetical protein